VSILAKSSFLHVKLTGGATAQLLGLMNAIYASDKLGLPFKISYYPYSTGTYWPFAIMPFLNQSEILNVNVPTKGLIDNGKFEIGKIIQSHPLMNKKISYEKILSLIRTLKLEPGLNFSRRELTVLASPKRLLNINNYYRALSGGFAAINEDRVNEELNQRFIKANKKSPFTREKNHQKHIVIHYRLGDKKAMSSHPGDFNSDKIIDPVSFKEIIDEIDGLNSENIYVVSDEPKLAQKLLADVLVSAKIIVSKGNIWEDLFFMSQARIFIGSNSQVSKLANICVENNGGTSYMFNVTKNNYYDKFKSTRYLKSKFLETNHKIYTPDFTLEENAHSAYF
jgi:hypothetical protein